MNKTVAERVYLVHHACSSVASILRDASVPWDDRVSSLPPYITAAGRPKASARHSLYGVLTAREITSEGACEDDWSLVIRDNLIDENGETNNLDRVVALILSEYEDIVFEKPEHTNLSRYFDEISTVEMVKAVECAVEKGYSPQIFKKHLKYLRSSEIQHSPELLKSFFPGELNEVIIDALSAETLCD